jgi:DNA segregation ATPase FtsK/SpoIIIE-like protein
VTLQDSPPLIDDRLLHQLNIQSGQINRVFSAHDLPAEVSGGVVNQRSVNFDLQTHLSGGLEAIRGLKDDLMAALGVRDVSIIREGGHWHLRVERAYEPAVPLLPLLAGLPRPPAGSLPIGLRANGHPFSLAFGFEATSHILVSGTAGAGKTSLLRAIAAGLAFAGRQPDMQLVAIDAADAPLGRVLPRESLRPLGYLPHMLTDPVSGTWAALELLRFLADEMDYRNRQHIVLPRIVVLVDHFVRLLETGGREARDVVLRLLQHGDETGIHLVLATGRVDSPLIDTPLHMSLPTRIVGKVGSAAAARVATGLEESYAEYLLGGGEYLAVTGDSVTRFQAAYIGDYDLHLRLSQLYAVQRPRLLAMPFVTRPQLRPAAPAAAEQSFLVDEGVVRPVEELDDAPLPFVELDQPE